MARQGKEVQQLKPIRVADPGNGKPFPGQASGYIEIVTAGAETRSLPNPQFIGQELMLYLRVDGGDCVVSAVAAINQTGNNTVTLNDAGDFILLRGMRSGTNLRWRVVVNDGCTLATA